MIGRTIGRYRVVEQLGQGGMGVVYKARDTVLDRFVAIKLLPPEKSSDPDRRQRFLQEAKAASALNHPGIVTVHDVLQVDGQDVLVMELVDGETLDDLMKRRRLPLGQALGLGVAVADALARAHAAGIVHRDLKPSNVMVTSEGVKVMDFGLAKLAAAPFHDPEAPTMEPGQHALTRERVILGTVPWMSPEQASGDAVDARSDIFSFGVLLYEMLTGHHPFRRASTTETLEAICSGEADPPTRHAPGLQPEVDRAVMRCLRRDPGKRWQNLSDLAVVLSDLKEDTESGRRTIAAVGSHGRRLPPWLLAAVTVVVLVTAGVILLRRGDPAPGPLELKRLSYSTGFSGLAAISPDGNLVAFTSDRGGGEGYDIWLRHIRQPEPIRLTDHPADDALPRFSPDGSRIVFKSDREGGGLYVVATLGGSVRRIADAGTFPKFAPDGKRVIFTEDPLWSSSPLRRMYAVPVNGGTLENLVPGWGVIAFQGSIGPVCSPDGELLLFYGAPLDDLSRADWWVAPIAGGEPRSSGVSDEITGLDVVAYPAAWLPDRLLVIVGTTIEGLNLYSVPISDEGQIGTPASPLTVGPGMTMAPSVSDDGHIALARFTWVVHLWEVDLEPSTGAAAGPPRRITDDAAPKYSFSLARDGARLAYSVWAGPRGDRRTEVVIEDLDSGGRSVPVSLTQDHASNSADPVLSGDGSMLSWAMRSEGQRVWLFAPLANPVGTELCRGCWVVDFFDDGQHVLVQRGNGLNRITLESKEETPFLELQDRVLLDSDLSRDDRWLATLTGEADSSAEIHVMPILGGAAEPRRSIEVARGPQRVGAPRWAEDGATLYYLSDRDDFICVWGQRLEPVSKEPIGTPFPVVHSHSSQGRRLSFLRHMWDFDVGGDRLVFNASEMLGDVYTGVLPPP